MDHDEVARRNLVKRHHGAHRATGSVHKTAQGGQAKTHPRGVRYRCLDTMGLEFRESHTRTVSAAGNNAVAYVVSRVLVVATRISEPHNEPLGGCAVALGAKSPKQDYSPPASSPPEPEESSLDSAEAAASPSSLATGAASSALGGC